MTKSELISSMAGAAGITKKAAGEALESIIHEIQNNEKVYLPGLGTFKLKKRVERMGRNPQTGADILIPAKTVLTFKSSAAK
jgi:DNA-binding protein HU-beta